ELLDAAVPDPDGVVVPHRRRRRRGSPGPGAEAGLLSGVVSAAGMATASGMASTSGMASAAEGRPVRPSVERLRPPGHREPKRDELRRVRDRERGPHLVLL